MKKEEVKSKTKKNNKESEISKFKKEIESKNVEKKKKETVKIEMEFDKKKILKGVGIVAAIILVLGLAFFVSNKNNKNTKAFEFIDITIDEYLDLMKKEEKSIIYVARPGCSWCQKESPIIKKVGSDFNLKMYYLNTDSFWDSELNAPTEAGEKFMNSSEHYTEGWGTPNTIIVAGGQIVDGEFGYVERTNLVDLFVRNGFIDE